MNPSEPQNRLSAKGCKILAGICTRACTLCLLPRTGAAKARHPTKMTCEEIVGLEIVGFRRHLAQWEFPDLMWESSSRGVVGLAEQMHEHVVPWRKL